MYDAPYPMASADSEIPEVNNYIQALNYCGSRADVNFIIFAHQLKPDPRKSPEAETS